MTGPAAGRRSRVGAFRAFLPWLALIALGVPLSQAQTPTTAPQDSPLRKVGDNATEKTGESASDDRDGEKPAPSRIGQIPTYGFPAASGASGSGFDSLNRTRKQPKLYPGQARPKPRPGPGSPAPTTTTPS